MFRNKIPETLKPGCLYNQMETSDYEQRLYLDGTEEPSFQKTLDCHTQKRTSRSLNDSEKIMNDEKHENGALTKVSVLVNGRELYEMI